MFADKKATQFMASTSIDIQALARGEEKAFQQLFIEYYPALISFGMKYINTKEAVEDLVQDVFAKIWENRESLKNIDDLSAYLYQMVRFKCFNYLRDEKAHSEALRSYADEMDTEEMNAYIKEEAYRIAMQALEELPPASQNVFKRVIEGYSTREIAEELNIAIETVKKHKQIARRILKEKLGRLYLFLF